MEGKGSSGAHELIVQRGSDLVWRGKIRDKAGAKDWLLPIQVDKLTYPRWEQARFSPDEKYILVPAESAINELLMDDRDCVIDDAGQSHRQCYVLSGVDLQARAEVFREPISASVLNCYP
jgi:hypothetical protein